MSGTDRAFGFATRARWATAGRPLLGERESGDLHLVEPFSAGVLFAALDGLGHGDEAALAARVAVDRLRPHAGDGVIALVQRCHEALVETRGVAMSLASFDAREGTLAWLGVGNVEGVLVRADRDADRPRELLMLRGGVVGYRLPALRAAELSVAPGDVLVFATDGVDSAFASEATVGEEPQLLADRILGKWGKATDDALVLVARFERGDP
jgi:negative regulator of sigma-B (phosphoserine phosphatase)